MQLLRVKHLFSIAFLFIAMSLAACSDEKTGDKSTEIVAEKAAEPVDIVARVDDEIITYGELNSMLNS